MTTMRPTFPRVLSLVMPVALALSAGACGRLAADEANAEEALDSAEMSQSEGALVASCMEDDDVGAGGGSSITAADLTAAALSRGAARFQPAGCATVSATGTTLTYTLDNCTGRFGLVHVTGTLTAVLTDAADGLNIAVNGSGLKVNRATMDVNVSAVLTTDGLKRTLVVSTNSAGTGARGNGFTRVGSYTVTRDPTVACVTLDGEWQLDIDGARTRHTTVTGYERCDGACPAAGGTLVHTGLLGRTVTVTFDGSATASWSSSTGRSGTVELTCGG